MRILYQLRERDVRLIQDVEDITKVVYDLDDDGIIDVESLICALSDMLDQYIKIEDNYNRLKEQQNEHDYFINQQIDKGMHPSEYE